MSNLEETQKLKEQIKDTFNKLQLWILHEKAKELKEKIEKNGCGKLIPTGLPFNPYACCKPCIGLLKGKYPFDSMCQKCQEAIKICEEILK